MRINHNIAALNTYRQLSSATNAQSKAMEKLSSGLRINRAGDDAAGLAISEKMRAQIRGLDQASRNAQDGISMIQTGEGALQETQSILQRMRELAVQAGNDTNTQDDRKEIQKEINELVDEIDRIANTTEFNTKKLLNGDLDNTVTTRQNENAEAKNVITAGGINLGSTNLVVTSAANSFAINYDGKTYQLNGLETKTYNGVTSTGTDMEALAKDMQRLIDENAALKGNVTISAEQSGATAGRIVITSNKEVSIENADVNTIDLSKIGLSSGMSSFEENYEIVGKSPFDVTSGFDVAAGKIDITYAGQLYTITPTNVAYDGSADNKTAEALVSDLQKQINADASLKGHISVSLDDNGAIRFSADKEFKISNNGTNAVTNFDKLGFTSGTKAVAVESGDGIEEVAATGKAAVLQIGANESQTFTVNISRMDSAYLGDTKAVEAAKFGEDTTTEDHYNFQINGAGLAGNIAVTSAANTFTINYGDKDYNITLDEVRTYDYTKADDMDALKTAIQDAINKHDDLKGKVSVDIGTNLNLSFSADKDFSLETADTNGMTLTAAGFGINAGTSAVEQKQKLQGTEITSFVDPAGGNFVLNYKGADVTLTVSDTVASDLEAWVADVQKQINANDTLKGKVTVGLEDNKLTFYSDADLKFVSTADATATAAQIGLTANQTSVEQDKIAGSSDESVGLLIKDLKVTDANATEGGVLSSEDAGKAVSAIDAALKQVSAERSKLGAYQNRLEHTINNLGTSSENLTAAESRIRDVDMAKEIMESTKNGILSQAAQAMLAQANQQPQGVLQLLR